jgi:hypothetical protein
MSHTAHPPAHILTKVRFLTTAEGGRNGPTPTDKLGMLFHLGEDLYECRLLLYEIGSISPGDEVVVPIWFLSPQSIVPKLIKGSRFKLCELKDVAEGEVIEILIEILEDQAKKHPD